MEHLLAHLLRYGTVLASGVTASGLLLTAIAGLRAGGDAAASAGMSIVGVGIALFIALPVGRVALMLGVFVHARERTYAAIAATVLAILAIGFIVAG